MASDPITPGNKEIESALRGLHPQALDDDFLDRLEAAAEGALVPLTEADLRFEESLRAFKPAPLAGDFLDRLESATAGVPFPATEKIVLFPKTAPLRKPKPRPAYRPWAAAAAVALIGGVTALMVPREEAAKPGPVVHRTPSDPVRTPSMPYSGNIAPASTNPQADIQDMGISWHDAAQPHRVLRLTLKKKLVIRNADGTITEIEQPEPEYIIIPEKMD